MCIRERVDTLDGRFGLGQDVGGAVILGIVTNLPEIAIVVSAAAGGQLELATGNILGGIAIQTVVLALLDIRSRSDQPLSSAAGSLVLSLEALTVVGVLTFALMGAQLDPDVNLAGLSPVSVVIAATWIGGLAAVRHTHRFPGWSMQATPAAQPGRMMRSHPEREPVDRYRRRSTRYVVGLTGIAALVTLGAGVAIEQTGSELAHRAGIGGAIFGATFLAAATALPEVSTGLAAIRAGNHQLAVSDILGGNAFLPVLFVLADLISGRPALPAANPTDLWLAALGVIVSGIYAVGVILRPQRDRWGMGLDSRLVVAAYLIGVVGLLLVN
jgi:cation:H+ antiporter